VSDISEWWPLLHEEIRRWLVNNYWSSYLPHDAVMWIVGCPDFERLNMPKGPDPRAAYFRRGWPRRQD
jgi:hypothetical protein